MTVALILFAIAFVCERLASGKWRPEGGGVCASNGAEVNPASLLPMADGVFDTVGNLGGFDNRTGSIGAFGSTFESGDSDD